MREPIQRKSARQLLDFIERKEPEQNQNVETLTDLVNNELNVSLYSILKIRQNLNKKIF